MVAEALYNAASKYFLMFLISVVFFFMLEITYWICTKVQFHESIFTDSVGSSLLAITNFFPVYATVSTINSSSICFFVNSPALLSFLIRCACETDGVDWHNSLLLAILFVLLFVNAEISTAGLNEISPHSALEFRNQSCYCDISLSNLLWAVTKLFSN